MPTASPVFLAGRKALITGIANDQSIAWGCAQALSLLGADIAITYLNDEARPHVERRGKTCTARWSTARRQAFSPQWMGHAGH